MRRALEGVAAILADAQLEARIDGNRLPPGLPCPARAIIGGDASERSIMAASILAKVARDRHMRSEEHTSELQSLMRISYAVFCLKKKKNNYHNKTYINPNNTRNKTLTKTHKYTHTNTKQQQY